MGKSLWQRLCLVFLLASAASCEQKWQITHDSAGKIRLGISLAQLKKELAGFQFTPTWDGDGVALMAVGRAKKTHAFVYAGDDRKGKVSQIEVVHPDYFTSQGVHPQMSVKEAERRLGAVVLIRRSEIESREYADFARAPKWLTVRLLGAGGTSAGVYPQDSRETKVSAKGAQVYSLLISGQSR